VELNLQGKPIEATTIDAYLKRKRKREGDAEDDDDGSGGNVNRELADEFDLPDYDGDESVDDDDDKYAYSFLSSFKRFTSPRANFSQV
jgi:hypothetical protein